ncbi:uncharacterized protein G2W53_014732 [Senna tora]|uniref:Uncharacterized protein n=1 Tax=Senna tora TaxID=362788 RepID=A0A834WU90_9FABA|nr:uncharacterized protein G2W53_014732 [Senna tora]
MSVRVVFAKSSGFKARIGVVMAWEERGSCVSIFRSRITMEYLKRSRIMRQKPCCASE